jgi:hypothetical protein
MNNKQQFLTLDTFSPKTEDLHSGGKYSQHQEEQTLKKILELLNINNGSCCEFGAWNGKYLSNVFHLIEKGWYGVLIEGDKDKFDNFKVDLEAKYNVDCISSYVGYNEELPECKLDILLKNTKIPKDFDILSIDIDSYDYFVLRDLEEYNPKILILEYNDWDTGYEYHIYKKGCGFKQRYGNSNYSAMVDISVKKGYVPIANTFNLICIRKDLYDKYINLKFIDDSLELGPAKYLSLFRYDNPDCNTQYLKKLNIKPPQR